MAYHAQKTAKQARDTAQQAQHQATELENLDADARMANTTVKAMASKVENAKKKVALTKAKLTEHQKAIMQGIADYKTARQELSTANSKEIKAKNDANAAIKMKADGEHAEVA